MENIKEMQYRAKAALLKPWMTSIVSETKKELRQGHLNQDKGFFQKYFPGQNVQRIGAEELARGYTKAIAEEEKGEQIAEFLFQRWLLKKTDLYHFFEKELSAITSDFTTLEELEDTLGEQIKERALAEFGAEESYLFSLINGVVFTPQLMQSLREAALEEQRLKVITEEQGKEELLREKELEYYRTEMARLKERYEKKLTGWERKYQSDIDALKKQVASLQRQLQAKS